MHYPLDRIIEVYPDKVESGGFVRSGKVRLPSKEVGTPDNIAEFSTLIRAVNTISFLEFDL